MNNEKEEFRYSENSPSLEAENSARITIPVIEEQIVVDKKVVETGQVTFSKKIKEFVEAVEIPLSQEEVVIKRVSKNELVDVMPPSSRYEGDVMIVSVLKEVAVVEKRMMLVEEIHISKIKSEKTETQEVTLRKEEVNVTRTEL